MAGWTVTTLLTLLALTGINTKNTKDPDVKEVNDLADSVNELGYRLLLQSMNQHPYENVAISPTSLAGLLAMTLLGSVGTTYDELADTLGFSQDILENRRNHEDFGELLRMLNANNTMSQTSLADAVFVEPDTEIRSVYHSYLLRVYNGDILPADFKHPMEAKDLINDWASNKTEGKIDEILQKPLPTDVKLVLLSALYFNGQWSFPFSSNLTKALPFYTPAGEVMANLMVNAGKFNYTDSEEDELKMLSFPYKDGETNMYVLLPKSTNLTDLMPKLTHSKISNLADKMKLTAVVTRFPKMELDSRLNMEESLKAIGVKSMFDEKSANFALMVENNNVVVNTTEIELLNRINIGVEDNGLREKLRSLPNPGIHVDTIRHNVKISIDEFGTEAAAVSGALLARTATLFYVSSPFYFFIRNERTKLVTFSAVVFDPTV